MARPGLLTHRKFIRLARLLKSDALAFGHLGIIWEACYESGDDNVGSAEDLEYLAKWQGEPGRLAECLVDSGFIDRDDATGMLRVHDLMDHAPEYVASRAAKESERRKEKLCVYCGTVYHSPDHRSMYCTDRCKLAAFRAKTKPTVTDASVSETDCNRVKPSETDSNRTPAHSTQHTVVLGSGVPEPMSAGADPSTNGNGKKVKEAPKGLLRLIELWNQIGGVQPCRYPTPKRIASYQQRAKNDKWMNLVKEALQKVAASAFCRGHNDRGWLADIDWFLKPDTVMKIIEGKYDNHGQPTRVADIPTGGRPIYNPETGEIVLAKE